MKKVVIFTLIINMLCCLTACDDGQINTMYELEDYSSKNEAEVSDELMTCINDEDADALSSMFSKNSRWQTDFYLEKDLDEQCEAFIEVFDNHKIVEKVNQGGPGLSGSEAAQPMYIYGQCDITLDNGDKYRMDWENCAIYDDKPDYLGLGRLVLRAEDDTVLADCGNYRLDDFVEEKRNWLLKTVTEAINTQNAQGLVDLIPEEYRYDGLMEKAEKCIEMFGGQKIKELPEYTLDYSGGNMDGPLTIEYLGFDIQLDDGRTFFVSMDYNLRDYDPMDYGEHGIHEKYGLTHFMVKDDKDNTESFGT